MNAYCLVKKEIPALLRHYYYQNESLPKNCMLKTAKASFKEGGKKLPPKSPLKMIDFLKELWNKIKKGKNSPVSKKGLNSDKE